MNKLGKIIPSIAKLCDFRLRSVLRGVGYICYNGWEMTETTTPKTPSPTPPANNSKVTVGKAENPQSVFTGMALDMSWRLALVVLIPIIGGYELDSKLGTTPLLTILGFLLAMAGSGLVMWRTLQVANDKPVPKPKGTAQASPAVTVAPKPKQEKPS